MEHIGCAVFLKLDRRSGAVQFAKELQV